MLAHNDVVRLAVFVFCTGVSAEFDVEYFFGNTLRAARELNCYNEVVKLYCETRCGENHACLFGKCFCLQSNYGSAGVYLVLGRACDMTSRVIGGCACVALSGGDKRDLLPEIEQEDKLIDFDDYIETTPAFMSADTFPERPALRHHIAHFCPNLEEARKCIRTCMELGKPAFCGKDHVCYCGHKSETPEGDEKVDVKEIYGQFRDLYKKYFGNSDYHDEYEYED